MRASETKKELRSIFDKSFQNEYKHTYTYGSTDNVGNIYTLV